MSDSHPSSARQTGTPATLEARYDATTGAVLLNGNQALIRLLLLQRERDRVASH